MDAVTREGLPTGMGTTTETILAAALTETRGTSARLCAGRDFRQNGRSEEAEQQVTQ